ncbi:PREDICTED: disease resistance protein TAO1-like isoform X2 [Camelina sativa]|uniref:Disease resistance protein TAO1-like isoform X2 n=1 Tax=Camelina sativa TaxID=90675 RepID=A0ABM0UHB0_CAMSA|nr:PREDICTED: disease resistance protein TAO1-like isoform X2 [Camelina sativa]
MYDVFLSFRGKDTRYSIVSHLYAALVSRGIITFKDDKRLEIGDHISDELYRAIEGSDFAVVVLSENYATSRWCLMELQLIMELQMKGRLGVFPVFNGVEPSTVRHQLGSFDLKRYQRPEDADKVPKWREALKLIADLSGVESGLCIDEATMVGKIVDDISRRKAMMQKIDFRNIVGVDTHLQDLKSLLDMDSNNDELQKELLYSTVGENIKPWSVEAGRVEVQARLEGKKVLLVIDGVDKVVQIHALAKETRWFGRGSRIIITTRDRGLLNSCGVKAIYEVKCLDDKDSLLMFKQIAFEGDSPPSVDFEQLSIRAAQLAHGLPSALQAYALFLRGRNNTHEEWEEAVCGLESTPDEDIMEILKISYKGLAEPHQNAFLHVACLFNGDTFQRVASLLDGSRPERNLGIRVLAEKSLINITNGYVILHNLVEQMGRKVMLDSGKFLGDPEKIQGALDYQEGTGQTECFSLHTCEMTCAFSMKTSVFNHMRGLKFFMVYKHVGDRESRLQVILDDGHHNIPYSLRLLHWDAFPLSTLPLIQEAYFLVELNLRHSNLETLWSGTQVFRNLKKLDVTGSKNLKQLPVLSYIQNLDELILEQCMRLTGIPKSIGKRSTLGRLNLSYYGGPKTPMGVVIRKVSETQCITLEFPTAKLDLELMNISIAGDIKFHFSAGCEGYAEYFSFCSEQKVHGTRTVSVHQAPRLISEFNKSTSLNIRRFSYKENSRPVTFHNFPYISGLEELKLVNLNIQKLSDAIGHFEFLEKLDFSGNDFESLPEDMNRLSRLKTLCLRNCSKLEELPELKQVQSLTLSNCRSLRSLVKPSDAIQDPSIYCLLELCLDNCKNVKSLSDQLSHFTKLTFLDMSSHDFKTLPSSIRDLTSLVTICLNNCKKLKSLEELPPSLQFLDAEGCDSLDADALEHFKGRLNKEVPAQPQVACFQETEMLSYERQGSKSRLPKFLCCSHF